MARLLELRFLATIVFPPPGINNAGFSRIDFDLAASLFRVLHPSRSFFDQGLPMIHQLNIIVLGAPSIESKLLLVPYSHVPILL